MALTGGVVVAVAIFDVLPENIDAVGDAQRVSALIGVGFIAFFIAERLLVLHHRDDAEHARAHAQVGVLGALGLSVHSFIDGLGIGLAFGLDRRPASSSSSPLSATTSPTGSRWSASCSASPTTAARPSAG